MSGKNLAQPIVVQAQLAADRYDITAYRVNIAADGPTVEVFYTCSRTEADGAITPVAERVRTFAGDPLSAAMAAATGIVTGSLLAGAQQAGILSAEQAAALVKLVQAQPALLALAYYNGTMDALYGLL